MGHELVPGEGGQSWSDILERFNIPKIIAGPAGEAFSRLIGNAIDIPSAKLQQISQGIKDKTSAKSAVSQAIATEVAKQVSTDSDLLKRAADSFLAKELRKQTNKESITAKTIEILAVDSASNDQANDSGAQSNIDADWLNLFEQYAENASSDRLQNLWSKMLAGEIRKPRSFSLQTLRFISELDRETAELFEKHSDKIVNGDFIPHLKAYNAPPYFADFLSLEEAGLLSGASGTFHKTFEGTGPLLLTLQDAIILIWSEGQFRFQVPTLLLTKIGREIATLTKVPASKEAAETFISTLPKPGIDRIIFQRTGVATPQGELLWEKVRPSPA